MQTSPDPLWAAPAARPAATSGDPVSARQLIGITLAAAGLVGMALSTLQFALSTALFPLVRDDAIGATVSGWPAVFTGVCAGIALVAAAGCAFLLRRHWRALPPLVARRGLGLAVGGLLGVLVAWIVVGTAHAAYDHVIFPTELRHQGPVSSCDDSCPRPA